MGVHRQAVAVCRGTAQPGNLRNEGGDGVFEFPTMGQSRTNKKRVPTAPVPGQGVVPLSAPKLRKENLCSTIFFLYFHCCLISNTSGFRSRRTLPVVLGSGAARRTGRIGNSNTPSPPESCKKKPF